MRSPVDSTAAFMTASAAVRMLLEHERREGPSRFSDAETLEAQVRTQLVALAEAVRQVADPATARSIVAIVMQLFEVSFARGKRVRQLDTEQSTDHQRSARIVALVDRIEAEPQLEYGALAALIADIRERLDSTSEQQRAIAKLLAIVCSALGYPISEPEPVSAQDSEPPTAEVDVLGEAVQLRFGKVEEE